jgi:hypothetical protein
LPGCIKTQRIATDAHAEATIAFLDAKVSSADGEASQADVSEAELVRLVRQCSKDHSLGAALVDERTRYNIFNWWKDKYHSRSTVSDEDLYKRSF